jgi:hypothetical protein
MVEEIREEEKRVGDCGLIVLYVLFVVFCGRRGFVGCVVVIAGGGGEERLKVSV